MGVNRVVPFLAVADMQQSVAFYVDGLGFDFEFKWEPEGWLQFCSLKNGGAGLMLQQFKTEGHDAQTFSDNKGEGVGLMFFCDDALAIYRQTQKRGIDATEEPRVGNGLWVTSFRDPDGYNIHFESPTDVPEGTKLSEVE